MPFTTTLRFALRKLTGASLISDIDAGFTALADDIDAVMAGFSSGPIASRPTSTGGSPGVAGRFYYATDQGKLYFDFGTGWLEMGFASAAFEPGDLKPTARPTASAGFLMCDGALVSTATYADLFTAIGHTWNGNVDPGGGQFRVPDLRGRTLIMVDGAAGRLTANDALGQSGGAEKVTLATSELPAHAHTGTTVNSGTLEHAHIAGSGMSFVRADGSVAANGTSAGFASSYPAGAPIGTANNFDAQGTTGGINASLAHGHTFTTDNTGNGVSHQNMSPYQVGNWLVKT